MIVQVGSHICGATKSLNRDRNVSYENADCGTSVSTLLFLAFVVVIAVLVS